MKYTIHGFSQQEAVKLKKFVSDNKGKEKEIKIDCTDLLILRWFVDFYPNMMKVEIEGVQYAWVQYKKLLQDLPLLDIKKQALFDRLKKLCEFKILKHKTVKVEGTFSYYGFGEMYSSLIDTECSQIQEGGYSTNEGVCSQIHTGEYSSNEQINSYIKNTSVKNDNSIKEKKKESKKNSFDEIITAYSMKFELPVCDEITDLLSEWLKVRKAKRAAMTDRAIQMNIDKLNDLAWKSGMSVVEYLKEVICRGWAAFYEIKSYGNNTPQPETKEPTRYGGTYIE